MPTRARATWRADGKLKMAAAASDIGTGTYTILTQIAAEAFAIPVDQVEVRLGRFRAAVQPSGGRLLDGGQHGCCGGKGLREAQARAGQSARRTPPDATSARHRRVWERSDLGSVRAGWRDRDRRHCPGCGGDITATATSIPNLIAERKHVSYSHSAVFAEVRVDEELGVPRVTRMVTAIAAGRILNPKTARSQILGGVVMGVGRALHEEGSSIIVWAGSRTTAWPIIMCPRMPISTTSM